MKTPSLMLAVLVGSSFIAWPAQAEDALAPVAQPAPRLAQFYRDPFADRLDALLQESRSERKRVVLFVHGQEIAGVVLDLGPGWVILSNQPEQQILLRTNQVERAEFR